MFSKRLRRLRGSVKDLSTIVYASVFLGVALPAGVAWLLLVRPARPATWVHIALACGVGLAIEPVANVVERIVVRRAEQKTAARTKAVS